MRIFLLAALFALSLAGKVNVVAAYPYIKAMTERIGGEHVEVTVLAQGNWDPHFVVPRPSLITSVRKADALIINGAQLEIGWIPPLINRAGNRKITEGGFLDLSRHVDLIDIPDYVTRSKGDVHPDGNPHFHLDPYNIAKLSKVISEFLSHLDPDNAGTYRANYKVFSAHWDKKLAEWKVLMREARGKEVIQYHTVFNYFLMRYGIATIGTIEPLPGISPSSRHTMELITAAKEYKPSAILHDVYHPTKTGEFISAKSGVPLIVVPHDIGALDSVDSLEAMFDHLVKAIAQ
jgi:zinc/manganese transport system substrate-binding protein